MTKLCSTAKYDGLKASVLPLLAFSAVILLNNDALAGTGGAEFDDLVTTVADWMQGSLGKLIALMATLFGLGRGVLSGSVGGGVAGLSIGMGLYASPTIADNVVSGTMMLEGAIIKLQPAMSSFPLL